jgi:hypothetical protein
MIVALSLLTLLTNLLRALAAYWELRAKRLRLDEIERTEKEAHDLQTQIDDLTRRGDLVTVHRLLVAKARRAAILEGLGDVAAPDILHKPDH